MVAMPGNQVLLSHNNFGLSIHQAAIVDENYVIIGGNLDESLKAKILNHEYVDFARLLPKDRMICEEDHRMEIVNRGGSTFFVPVVDRETAGSINGFGKWEQAFRVFSNVYTKYFPERATELIQYYQLIHTVSHSFTWENVYHYDKEFRMHLSNYPQCNWGIILQQAWSMCLKDHINQNRYEDGPGSGGKINHQHNQGGKRKDICLRFNKGKCKKGFRCQYDHRCLGCSKFGHRVHICRDKTSQDSSEQNPTANAQKSNANNKG